MTIHQRPVIPIIGVSLFILGFLPCWSQSVGEYLPKTIDHKANYLFYLHGGVVTELGNNAINQSVPEWGPYEYFHILDSLKKRGFNVISEMRKKGVPDSVYMNKIGAQIDSLLTKGSSPSHILVVGASAGWDIGIRVSSKKKNKKLSYVMMGGCWPESYKDYLDLDLYGHFLSIIETSDPHGTCNKVFENRKNIKSSKEIKLNTGWSHGFIYKGHKEWIDPIVLWWGKR